MTLSIEKTKKLPGAISPRAIFVVIALLSFAVESNMLSAQQLKPIQPKTFNQQPVPSAPELEFEESPPAQFSQLGNQMHAGQQRSTSLMPLASVKAGAPDTKKNVLKSAEFSAASYLSETAELGLDDQQKADGDYVQAVFEIPHPNRSSKPVPTLEDVESAEQAAAVGEFGKAVHDPDSLKENIEGEKSFFDTLVAENFFEVATEPYRRYRSSEASLTHLAGSSRSFGWTSMEWEPYLKRAQSSGLTGSIQHHFLSGPRTVDMPARLHDFILGYQHRGTNGTFSYDCAASVGVFSDFQGSAREGVRFPAHAVGIIHASHRADLIFGVDYLDRDDYKILPVLGVSWHDLNFASLRYDLVFPRPRIEYTFDEGQRIYLAGRLGGGTWDIENPDGSGDVMNYRDFRILGGLEQRYLNGSRQALELGYVFGRQLSLRGFSSDFDFRNAFIIRLQSTY